MTSTPACRWWLWLAFFASFAVKMPMWPVHTWLPDAHVQAPTAGSVILAGVLLKMGGYGFIRFSLPMFPEASAEFVPFVFVLSGIAVVYTSLVALAQRDMKKLIAYSSVAHMAFVTFGLFAFNRQGIEGAMMVMLSHGLVSGALFLVRRRHLRPAPHPRDRRYGGLSDNMPGYALLFMLFTMASVGLPGTSGFVGEFLALIGTYQRLDLGGGRRHHRDHPRRRPTCSTSTGGSASATQRHADAAAMQDLRTRGMVAAGADRRGGAVDGRLSRKLHGARCAPTSGACSSGSSAPRRRAIRISPPASPSRPPKPIMPLRRRPTDEPRRHPPRTAS